MTNDELTIATAPLGHTFAPEQLKSCKVFGAVAWPGKQPGFALVLAVTGDKHDPYEIHLLDEVESGDLMKLVHQCDAMDAKYLPVRWMGRPKKAADEIVGELRRSRQPARDPEEPRRAFNGVCGNAWTQMEEGLYEVAMPRLKQLLQKDNRQLFLKASRVVDHLGRTHEEEFPFMGLGEYPAIEALAYGVREALDSIEAQKRPPYRPSRSAPGRNSPFSF